MKILGLLVLCGVLLFAEVAVAGDCRQLDYAEIKDTPTAELTNTYCLYESLAKINYDGQMGLFALAKQYSSRVNQKQYDIYEANYQGCTDMAAKISAALKRRGIVGLPQCEKPK